MKRVEEIYWLRFYGAMAVFTFHLIDRIELYYVENTGLDLLRIPSSLGTPIFIFISIFLFSIRYGEEVPKDFLARRLKYIMVPYFVYGMLYLTAEYLRVTLGGEQVSYFAYLREYLLFAGWHGYFLVVAMQFYILFWVYNRFRLWEWLPAERWLIPASLVSMAWWGYFRWYEIEPPGYLHWIAPIGWIYLFFLALLIVKYYPDIRENRILREFSRPIWLAALLVFLVYLTFMHDIEYSSKESWIIPLFAFALLFAMPKLLGVVAPPLVRKVNEASFVIYLAHPLFFSAVDLVGWNISLPLWLYVIALAVVGMGGSIILSHVVNRADWSAMLLGRRLKLV
ncbi:MAG: acyltransferase [Salinarimonas sp.]|nr:acyltransferase [Salinarimonas sp.]